MCTSWGQLSDKLISQANEKRIPVIGQFELTSRCNLQCKMCYICRPANDGCALEKERSADEWIRLAGEARDAGMLYLLLTGGEVFLRRDFKEIYEEISMMGFNTTIYTNATMITPEIAKWLGRIPPSKIGVTIYGASPETYARVCGHADAFMRASRGIDLLLDEGMALDLKTTLIRSNADDFYEIAEFAEKRGLEFGAINYISQRREGNNTSPHLERLSPRELAESEMQIYEYFKMHDRYKLNDTHLGRCFTDHKSEYEDCENVYEQDNQHPFYCSAGKSSFWVTWDGLMTSCADIREPAEFPFEKGFNSAWKGLVELCSSIPVCKECRECEIRDYCMSCPAALKNETGFYDKPANYLCEWAQNRKNLALGISRNGI